MVHGAVRKLFQLLGALVAGLLIALSVLAWRLSSGPIALDVLTPYIEEALTAKDGAFAVRFDSTVLTMGGDRMLEIRVRGVRAYAGAPQPIATVPELALTLSGRALIHGVLAPRSVRLLHPVVRLLRDPSGALQWGIGGEGDTADAGEVVAHLRDALVGAPDPAKPGRALQLFAIEDAEVVVEDRAAGTTWHAPDVDLAIRRVPAGLEARGQVTVDLAGETASLGVAAAFDRQTGALDGEARLDAIRPAVLARIGGPVAALAALDMPLSGTLRAAIGGDGGFDGLSFDLSGGAGSLRLPAPVNTTYPVQQASLKGRIGEGFKRLDLDELRVEMGGGPVLTASAVAEGLGGDTTVRARAVARDVAVDSLRAVWPQDLAPPARDWVVNNLSGGRVSEAHIDVALRSRDGSFNDVVVTHIGGEVHPAGVTVEYLRPMPPVRNAVAACSFDAGAFRIAIKGGEVYGLHLRDGLITLGGLDKPDQWADIELVIQGPVTDALKLIDSPPLRYATMLGVEPAGVAGEALTRLRLKFPLLKTLKLDDLSVKAHASVKGARIQKVMMGLDLTEGALELDIDNKGLDAAGPIALGGIPAELKWHENFNLRAAPFRSRYQLQAPRINDEQRRLLGLDGVPFVAPWLSGPIGAAVVATFNEGGKGEVEARLDLAPARMELPGLGWSKDEGEPGTADVLVRFDKYRVTAVPRFAVASGDLTARGQVAFDAEGKARRVEFSRLAYGRTDGEGSVTLRPGLEGALDIAFKGASFDAAPLLSSKPAEGDKPRDKDKDKLPPMTVAVSVRSLWLSEQGRLTEATAVLARDADDWRSMSVKGGVGEGKSFFAVLHPGVGRKRTLSVRSDDAGAVARAFDVYDDMSGGTLVIDGSFDDTQDSQPLTGTIKVSDYHIRNAPALARLLTVAALTGILDLLRGEGIGFSSLEAPFTYADGLLEVRDGRAWGAALGITARGQIDLDHGRLALEGTVVPAYAINSVLGNIPVLGWLVTGGERGGGFLAFNYGMKGESKNPDVLVNPLSVLTPGFLRNLFNIFDDGSETEARKKAK